MFTVHTQDTANSTR